MITYRLPEHTFRTWGLYENQPLVQADSFPAAPTSWGTFHNKIKTFYEVMCCHLWKHGNIIILALPPTKPPSKTQI